MIAVQFVAGLALLWAGLTALAGWPVAAVVVGVVLAAPTAVRTLRRPVAPAGDR